MQNNASFEGIAQPAYFFALEADCRRLEKQAFESLHKKYLLPSFGKLWDEEIFAKVYMAWSESALHWTFVVEQEGPPKVSYPKVEQGDSIELFIDTKNLKTAKLTHRFSHHFYFLPERIEGVMTGEITRFRTEDTHPLCNADDIELTITHSKKGYVAEIVLSEKCLVGLQPEEKGCIGFSYRINRASGPAQHFAPSSHHCTIDQHPYLWPQVYIS